MKLKICEVSTCLKYPFVSTTDSEHEQDSDGDGIPDAKEGMLDPDGDGLPNYLDLDSDGDRIPDSMEGNVHGPDGDGIPNYLDLDSDGDGISDSDERRCDVNIANPACKSARRPLSTLEPKCPDDTDNDGVPSYLDLDSDDDGIFSCSCFPTLICIILAVAPSVVLETFQTSS